MTRFKLHDHSSLTRLALCVVLTVSFAACSKNASSTRVQATGGISFSLAWNLPQQLKAKALFSPSFNACVDYAIDTITASVYDANNSNQFVASDSWPCSAHQGVIYSVPSGTNYIVQVQGMSLGTALWNGYKAGVSVGNQITDAGTIAMTYIGGDVTNPIVIGSDPAPNATNVPVTSRITVSFSESMAISTVTSTNIQLVTGGSVTVQGNVSYDPASNSASFTPSAILDYNTEYVLQVASGITDVAGKPLASTYTNTFTTETSTTGMPATPTGVTAVPGNSQVTLSWQASNGATTYNIYSDTTSGVTATSPLIASVTTPFYIHFNLTNGTTYYYVVTAVNGINESTPSSEVSATPVADPLAANLMAYYPFTGNTNDASGKGYNGTVTGATLTTDRFEFANNAYSFDGSGDINLGNLGDINDYSVSLWFRKAVASGYPASGEVELFATDSGAGQYFKVGFNSPDQIKISIATTVSDYQDSLASAVTDTTWHHLVVTRSGTTVQAYIDDVLQTLSDNLVGDPSGTISTGTWSELGMVSTMSGTTNFSGVLDDVRVYSRVLSASDVTLLYNAANPNVPAPPANVSASPDVPNQNVITWSPVSGATSYNLYWSTSPIFPDKSAADNVIRGVSSPFTQTGLTTGQTIYYIVTAVNSYGESAESIQVSALVP